MFNNNNDVIKFINDFYSLWEINQTNNTILLISKNMATKSEGIPNQKIINQVLTYATELERIV